MRARVIRGRERGYEKKWKTRKKRIKRQDGGRQWRGERNEEKKCKTKGEEREREIRKRKGGREARARLRGRRKRGR